MKYSRFRNKMGNHYLLGLFYEMTDTDKSSCLYTLKDEDHLGYPSLYRLYMEVGDPTEYLFATQCLEGWLHWTKLRECLWFQEYISRWRTELATRLSSQALSQIKAVADAGGKEALAAAKYLYERAEKIPTKRGRPIKDTTERDARQKAIDALETKADQDRLNLQPN